MPDELFAEISERAVRYFLGWAPKPFGQRRFAAFEGYVRDAIERHLAQRERGA